MGRTKDEEDARYERQCEGPDLERAEDAQVQEEQLGFRIDAYLRKAGWKATSSTPGCYWLWEKKLKDGRIILVNKDMAISMQSHIESGD